jgi:hypothetical protein
MNVAAQIIARRCGIQKAQMSHRTTEVLCVVATDLALRELKVLTMCPRPVQQERCIRDPKHLISHAAEGRSPRPSVRGYIDKVNTMSAQIG